MRQTFNSYQELIQIPSFLERFNYLKLEGAVGESTFGFDRCFNQMFYRSVEWKSIRDKVIIRDMGRDLAMEGYEIHGQILVHHMNPITLYELENGSNALFDMNQLITTTLLTHNAIHYGDAEMLPKDPIVRRPNDTCPWRKNNE